jgi:hypothetical protein
LAVFYLVNIKHDVDQSLCTISEEYFQTAPMGLNKSVCAVLQIFVPFRVQLG